MRLFADLSFKARYNQSKHLITYNRERHISSAFARTFLRENIIKAFTRIGVWAYDRDILTHEDFLIFSY